MLMFGWDFEVDPWSRLWRWNLIKICEIVTWPQEVTLLRWTQPSGPLCLWQCFDIWIIRQYRYFKIYSNGEKNWHNLQKQHSWIWWGTSVSWTGSRGCHSSLEGKLENNLQVWNKVTTRWEGPQSLSYHKQSLGTEKRWASVCTLMFNQILTSNQSYGDLPPLCVGPL